MITLTENAQKQVRLAIEDEDQDGLALRVAVNGRGPTGYLYKMDLVGPEEREENDQVIAVEGFDVLVDPESAPCLQGATIDFVQRLQEAGFKFDNPNSPWADNPMAERVASVIEEQINPSIASHGGFVTLLDVKDATAYISMGGGCQGCSAADVTLKHGIESAILEHVPEIQQVLDTTDHAAGTNPYYRG
ncbi:MAG: iron-sulfur cluster assembly accessory protein [Acidobacteriota bacterium]